jgi:phosphate uptake regulator
MTDETAIDLDASDYDDPICAEIRRIRDEIDAECNHDMGELFRSMRERERLLPPERFGSPPRRHR